MADKNVAVFTKANPCTKVEIWNAFRGARGFRQTEESEVLATIGRNVPRVLLNEGRAERVKTAKGDFYRLTKDGQEWLRVGLRRYLRNNPEKAKLAVNLPKEFVPEKGS